MIVDIMLVTNLNYWVGVHINFAQSRIPELVCSPQSEYGCQQARSQGYRLHPGTISNHFVFILSTMTDQRMRWLLWLLYQFM